jgi:hypothetical protein
MCSNNLMFFIEKPAGNARTCGRGLVKIRGLMYGGKDSAVIGRETRFFVCARYEYAGYGCF